MADRLHAALAAPSRISGGFKGLVGNHFLRALGRSLSSGMGALALRLASIAILSRLVMPDEFGGYFLGQSAAILLATMGNLAYSYRTVETSSVTAREAWAWMAASAGLTLGLLGVVALVAELVWPGEAVATFGEVGLLVAGSAPVLSALRTAEALGRRLFEFRWLALAELWATLLGFLLLAPLLALLGMPAAALAGAQWTYALLKLWLVLHKALPGLPSTHIGASTDGRSGRYTAFGLELLDLVSVHLLRIVIGAAFGQAVVGLWSRASQLILLGVNLLVAPVATVLIPLSLRDAERRNQLTAQAPVLIDVAAFALLPVCMSIYLLSPEITVLLLGADWGGASAYLAAFSLLPMVRTVQRAFGILGRATRSSGRRFAIDGGVLLAYATALAGLMHAGPLSAAWTFSISCAIAAGLHFLFAPGDRPFIPWRYLLSLAVFAAISALSATLDLAGEPALVGRALLVVLAWVAAFALVLVSSRLKHPIIPGGLVTEFARRMNTPAIK